MFSYTKTEISKNVLYFYVGIEIFKEFFIFSQNRFSCRLYKNI